MNPNTHPLTGAELQTLREACGLSRESLAELAGVAARTVKHWETRPGTTVPADVGEIVCPMARWVRQAAAEGLASANKLAQWSKGEEAPEVVLIRYRETADMAQADRAAGLRADVHGAMVARLVLDLIGEGYAPRVVWFDPEHFRNWREALRYSLSGEPADPPEDSPDLRASWAAQAVDRQTTPHPSDQPPRNA